MSTAGRIAALRNQLVATAGGYLRNPVRHGTCTRCYTPVSTAGHCPPCRSDATISGLPDAIGFMTYASYDEPIQQSGRTMRDYKSPIVRSTSATKAVALLTALVSTAREN